MDKLKETLSNIAEINKRLMDLTQERLNNLTKPIGSLGRLEELARLIAGITAKENPKLKNKAIFTFAADHGVAREGVSAYPQEVTAQMVYNFLSGGAGINVLARHAGARVIVADLGVVQDLKPHPALVIKKINYGTKNMAVGPAMTRPEAIKAIEAGIEIFTDEFSVKGGSASGGKKGIDIIGTGEMGIGNTTAASAITAVITKKPVADVTGKGTGIDDKGMKNKIRVIKKALALNKPDPDDAIDILAKVGGFEIGGLAGIILAAASKRVPVIIDGFISAAAALIAYQIEPKTKDYMIASHCSVEKGHKVILEYLGLKPLLDLNLRLGEGTGAALGINIIDAAIKILTQMATFKSAGVSQKTDK
ncbi:MAG: nicotinate-nucleotide--dimethylbenzimidazole phosphoribosyltransferase [Candidatus Omnitrophica bacterium]|nr:nicotinate-nucleotide--dimethylbenzimidazole phosphoribosyltransferase [Candidatus Omnitrophota bacterium]MDD5591745.1 nicotinate-nucleotide--dimethylbenzimidazole phosphoribosyltransferase [Candidatus Omnitrophota bacterium]